MGGRPIRRLELARDAALVTILRGNRVIVPEPDEPLEGGDELLVAAPEVGELRNQDEPRAVLGAAGLTRCSVRIVGVHGAAPT